ncbi:MAG: nitroreductase family protein [Mahellales bacterium]
MLDLLMARRSIRKFKDREVEKEKIDMILKAGLLSPSSRGRRPWEFIVVNDKQILKTLSSCRDHGSQFLAGAPLGIVVIADTDLCDVWIEDASIAAIVMQLTAHSMGLGSCWIQVRGRYHSDNEKAGDYIKRNLGIPEKYSVECIIALGYKDEDKPSYDEESLPYNKLHYNGF